MCYDDDHVDHVNDYRLTMSFRTAVLAIVVAGGVVAGCGGERPAEVQLGRPAPAPVEVPATTASAATPSSLSRVAVVAPSAPVTVMVTPVEASTAAVEPVDQPPTAAPAAVSVTASWSASRAAIAAQTTLDEVDALLAETDAVLAELG